MNRKQALAVLKRNGLTIDSPIIDIIDTLADELSELHPSMGIDDINDLADDLAHLIGALC